MEQASNVLDKVIEQRLKWVNDAHQARLKLEPHLKVISAIAHAVGARLEHDYGDRIVVVLKTNDLKGEGLRLLESISEATGVDFGSSHDTAEEWGASRTFQGKNLPINVVAELPMEADDGCRRVQVGVKEVPVFKLVCDGEEQQ